MHGSIYVGTLGQSPDPAIAWKSTENHQWETFNHHMPVKSHCYDISTPMA